MNRRELLGMTSVGVIALLVAGRFALAGKDAAVEPSNFPVRQDDAEWRALLSSEAYHVLRENGTEVPYSSPLLREHRPGVFSCAGCQNSLFRSETKFDSHTGWPSFWDVIPDATVRHDDNSLGMSRTEVLCANCGGHLGHVFEDGPKPTGLRYCMNGVAMHFRASAA